MKLLRKGLWNVLGFGVLFLWLVMMGLLVKKTYFQPPSRIVTVTENASSVSEEKTWMSIYHHDEKIGYVKSRLIKQADGFIVADSARMNLRVGGTVQRISTSIIGHLHQDGSLRSFVFRLTSGLVHFEARGKVEDKYMIVNSRLGGEWRQSKIRLKDKPLLSVGLWPYLMKNGIKVGTRWRVPVFDPSVMAERQVDVEVLSREVIVLDGKKWDALKVKTMFMGTEVFSWIGPNGERLQEESFMGLRLVRASEQQALSGISFHPETDLAEEASIACNMVLGNTSEIAYLKVRLDGINPEGLDLDGGRQHFKDFVLEITRETTPLNIKASRAYEMKQIKHYLAPEPMVESNHPSIKTLARKIVGGAKDPESKARRILRWVYKSLDKRVTVSIPDALVTLKERAGDCNEHAVLFAALSRAAGVPARLCAGLVYNRKRFYYHAWNEVFLGRWVTADALMGEMPADVTHIRFVEGGTDRQADMVRVIGRVKVTVLEARESPKSEGASQQPFRPLSRDHQI